MKRLFQLFTALLLLGVTCGPLAAEDGQPRGVLLDRIVAVVNDDVIMASELETEMERIRMVMQQSGYALPAEDAFREQVLDRMVTNQLQLQFAKRAGITVSDDRVNQALTGIAGRSGATLSELPEMMARDGVNYAEFREAVREEILISEVQRRAIDDQVSVSPREIEEYLARQRRQGEGQEYRVSHILVAVPGQATPEEVEAAREQIVDIRERVVGGEDFARMAATYSDGQQALKGGDLGWRKLPEMPTLFADVVAKLDEGEVSEPIRSGSGWHMVKLEEVRGRERVVATETHARHILLKPNELRDEAATMAMARRLKWKIEEGADFAELAREHSEDPGSAVQGGDLGWQPPGTMVPRFEEVLDRLEPGEISAPFKTQFGIHIVQVLDRRETDFTETVAQNRAYQAIKRRKAEEQLPIWLQQQRDQAHIEIRLED